MSQGRVLWKLPGSSFYTLYTGIWEPLSDGPQIGFIYAPFEGKPFILAEAGISLPLQFPMFKKIEAQAVFSEDQLIYTQNIRELLDAMKHNPQLKKVVLSRTRTILADIPDTEAMFFELCRLYPHAACSLIEIQDSIWLGASPELLMHYESQQFQTMSLAGTRTIVQNQPFGQKEEKEQALVTEEINHTLKHSGCKNIEQIGPYIRQAGNLLHLCTEIKGSFHGNPLKLAAELHPTPAVGGLPVSDGLHWIHQLEQHDRRFFCGYLGTSDEHKTTLYVHLRCMEINGKRCTLYAGAGITAESDPEEEWKETENKTETLFSALFINASDTKVLPTDF